MSKPDMTPRHRSRAELEAGLADVARAPAARGRLELIVARPRENARSVLEHARLDAERGLDGDYWHLEGKADKRDQLTLMAARAAALIAEREHWPLAGDQLYVDLDLSRANLPPGARLAVGTAVVEISDEPHLGCSKFRDRFGRDALKLFNSRDGRQLQLRGVNAFVVQDGEIGVGDVVAKLER